MAYCSTEFIQKYNQFKVVNFATKIVLLHVPMSVGY